MIQGQLRQTIQAGRKALGLPEVEIGLEHPAQFEHGDFSSNIAMVLFSGNIGLRSRYKTPAGLASMWSVMWLIVTGV